MQLRFPRARGSLLFLVLSLTASQYANSQVSGGTIRGSVTDPSGAVIPSAHVLIENDATRVEQSVNTNGAGIYIAPDLNPGTYSITTSAPGFSTIEQTGANLTVGAVLVINVVLTVGSNTEKVVVNDTAAAVERGTSELSGVVGQDEVTQRPLNGSDWSELAQL